MILVLDASALLALLHDELGTEGVKKVLNEALVSAVNWAEVVQKSLSRQVDVAGMLQDFSDAGVVFEPFTPIQAELATRLWMNTRQRGLSLADRACLAPAVERNATVLTADRAWGELELGVEIQVVR